MIVQEIDTIVGRLAELGSDWYVHSIGDGTWGICYMPFCLGATSCSRRALVSISSDLISECLELAHQHIAEGPRDYGLEIMNL